MNFRAFLLEQTFYHGTTNGEASLILQNGFDISKYKSGTYEGIYLTPNINYFDDGRHPAILKAEIDPKSIMDVKSVTESDLAQADPHYKMMSYGYRNHLVKQIALQRGFKALKDGPQIILIDPSGVESVSRFK